MTDDALLPVIEWLREHNDQIDTIPRDLDLIDNRIINSLDFMEFILLIEDLIDRELDLREHTLDQFRTLDAIAENFLDTRDT